jgi:hypothetical protein
MFRANSIIRPSFGDVFRSASNASETGEGMKSSEHTEAPRLGKGVAVKALEAACVSAARKANRGVSLSLGG